MALGTIGGFSKVPSWIDAVQKRKVGYYGDDPRYRERRQKLQQEIGGQLEANRLALMRQGYSPEDAERMLGAQRIQGRQAASSMFNQYAGLVDAERRQRAQERRERRSRLLGTGLSLATAGIGAALYPKHKNTQAEFDFATTPSIQPLQPLRLGLQY